MNKKENISNGEYKECMEVIRSIDIDSETKLQLSELAKAFWLRGSTTYVSADDLLSLLELGIKNIKFTLNFVKKNRSGTTSTGLGDRVLPQLVEAGMISRDTTGRYVTYTVQRTGVSFILWWILKCYTCDHSGNACYNCEWTLKQIGGIDGLLEILEHTKPILIN